MEPERQDERDCASGASAAWVPTIRALAVLLAALVTELAWPSEAAAIPVFARKYETSCQTCHSVFPKLTPFGEAFRRNGYRFPAGEDEDASQDETIPLGQEAHADLFPDSVWPADLPGMPPIGAQVAGRIDVTDEDPEVSFAQLGGTVGLNFAATFGDTISAWAGAALRAAGDGTVEPDLERVFVVFKPFDEPVLNVRVGRFEPGLLGMTVHRTLGFGPWLLTTPVRDDPFTIDPVQLGLEATGVAARGRFTYSAGLVEGGGNQINVEKDAYSRLAVKIGGMRLDGVGGATGDRPWRETSVQLGGFGYFGQSRIGDPALALQEDRFFIAGGDVMFSWRDLNLWAAGAFGRNQRPSLLAPDEESDTWHAFGQVDYVVFPWLVPTVRYEHRSVNTDDALTTDRISGGAYALIRANVRTQLLASTEGLDGDFEFDRVIAGLNLAF